MKDLTPVTSHDLQEGFRNLGLDLGDVLFFHCCTIHGSMPNISDHSRKTILIQLYSGKDTIVDGNQHTNVQLVLRGWNYNATRESIGNIKS